MRHFQPAHRDADNRWDYVCIYNNHVFPVGYCAGWQEVDEKIVMSIPGLAVHLDRLKPHKAKFHTDGHATGMEAAKCHRDFLLDSCLRLYAMAAANAECLVCSTPTEIAARIEPRYGYFPLCHQHMTRKWVEALFEASHFILT